MEAKKRGRKSPSKDFLFELVDEDVSSDSDCNEPEFKLLKSNSTFVDSVVNALSNLENEENTKTEVLNTENSDSIIVEFPKNNDDVDTAMNSQALEQNVSLEILGCITPNAKFDNSDIQTKLQFEEGEIDIENTDANECTDQTIQINFANRDLSKLYKSKFLKFLITFDDLVIVKESELSLTLESVLKETNINTTTKKNETSPSTKKKKKKKNKKEKDLFVLDTTPSKHESSNCAKYNSKFNIEINDGNDDETKISSNQVCFNCEQNHSLRDCPLPKDYGKINMMRQKFKKDRQTSRYHLEEDQKFAHLTPGKISDKLREALGLKDNQLPPYVYQMRTLGYPPGWLEEAKLVYSNLALFDTDGKNVGLKNSKKTKGLDVNKIVEYPGFNAPMDKSIKDEYRQFRVPPYSENCSKKAMLDYFENEYGKQQDDLQTEDMDIDITDEKCPEHLTKKVLLIKDVDMESPSLIDLETQKQSLLNALEDSSSNLKSEENTNDVLTSETSEIDKVPTPSTPPEEQDEPLRSAEDALSEMFPTDKQVEKSSDTLEIKTNPKSTVLQGTNTNTVLTTSFGTPILKSGSPYDRLPKMDNFVKDVSPVINFENLPNSTGKYEQMTGILQKVRNTMKQFQQNSS